MSKLDNDPHFVRILDEDGSVAPFGLLLSVLPSISWRLSVIDKHLVDTEQENLDIMKLIRYVGESVGELSVMENEEVVKAIDAVKKAFGPDILVDNFQEEPALLYSPKGINVGTIYNSDALASVRAQIKEKQAEGYYLKYNDDVIDIDKNGNLSKYPEGFFESFGDNMAKLV